MAVQGGDVVRGAGQWIGDPPQGTVEGCQELDADAGAVVLAGVEFRLVGPGPPREQGDPSIT